MLPACSDAEVLIVSSGSSKLATTHQLVAVKFSCDLAIIFDIK